MPDIERWARREEPQLEHFHEFVLGFNQLRRARGPRR
jgi:hypothetical protein